MKLYLLGRTDVIGYDEFMGFVVAAPTSPEARKLANESSGDEGEIWSDCTLVKATCLGPASAGIKRGIILGSYHAG